MNKFAVLNTMQRNITLDSSFMNMKTWAVNIKHTYKGVTRSRSIAYITKVKGSYVISMTGEKFKTFMGALASLILRYTSSLLALIASMIFDDNSTTSEIEFNKAIKAQVVVSKNLKDKINRIYQEVKENYANSNITGYLKIDVAFLIYVNHLTLSDNEEIIKAFGIDRNQPNFNQNCYRAIESLIN